MHHAPTLVADLAIVACVAAITGMLARVFRQPRILGYLLAGLLVGPAIPFPLFADPDRVLALAEFGVVLVMFAVGLEFRVSTIAKILPTSGFTGLVQVGTMIWAGFTVGGLLGWDSVGATFLGASLAVSSTMVVTSIFAQQPVDRDVRENVLGVLVIQDVVAIALVAAMTALAAGQSLEPGELALLVAQLAGMLVGMLAVGMLIVPRLVRWTVASGGAEGISVLAVGLAFGFALLAQSFGYSVALGAFVAGILVAESGRGHEVEQVIEPLRAVFAAIFFVSVGMAVNPNIALANLPVALLVAGVVIVGQLLSVGVASVLSGTSLRRGVISGLALGQIGEFSFIIATIGAEAGVVPEALLAALVTVATITSFTTAALLRHGDGIVQRIDRLLPDRLQHLITLHQRWMERLRAGGDERGAPFRQALYVLAADWVALVVLAAVAFQFHDPAVVWLRGALDASNRTAILLVNAAIVLLVVPLLVGLFRNARLLGHTFAQRVVPDQLATSAAGRRVTRLLEAIARLGMLVGVGIPALALLRPLVGGPWGEPLLLVGVGLAIVMVWRNLGEVEGELRSGAEQLAHVVAKQAGEEVTDELGVEPKSLFPGLDDVVGIRLADGTFAVRRTLAEINLRVLTGATVVAIHKPNAEVLLPTGYEHLEAGDVLALTGAPDATERARVLLAEGPEGLREAESYESA